MLPWPEQEVPTGGGDSQLPGGQGEVHHRDGEGVRQQAGNSLREHVLHPDRAVLRVCLRHHLQGQLLYSLQKVKSNLKIFPSEIMKGKYR